MVAVAAAAACNSTASDSPGASAGDAGANAEPGGDSSGGVSGGSVAAGGSTADAGAAGTALENAGGAPSGDAGAPNAAGSSGTAAAGSSSMGGPAAPGQIGMTRQKVCVIRAKSPVCWDTLFLTNPSYPITGAADAASLSLSGPGGWYTVLADHTIATLSAHAAKPVVGVTDVAQVVLGAVTVAVKTDGTMSYDATGTGTFVAIPELSSVVSASVEESGAALVCAVLKDGSTMCSTFEGGSHKPATAWAPLPGVSGISQLVVATRNYCALVKADGTVKCWTNKLSNTGPNGATVNTMSTPTAVAGLSGVSMLSSAAGHFCALLPNGTVKCWGDNNYAQLGTGDTTPQTGLVTVAGVSNAISLTSVSSTTGISNAVLTSDGKVLVWGPGTTTMMP